MRTFNNQVAIVTGAADGIGKAIASKIADNDGTVILVDLNEPLLQKTLEEFRKTGFKVDARKVDISKEDQVKELFAWVVNEYGKVDIMVNSAGIVGPTSTSITDYPVEAFDQIYSFQIRCSASTDSRLLPNRPVY